MTSPAGSSSIDRESHTSVDAETERPVVRQARLDRRDRSAVLAAVLLTALGVALVVRESTAPAFYNDEMGTLGASLLFADPLMTWTLTFGAYMPGMAVLVAPLWWIWTDPSEVYRAASILGGLLSVLALVPLSEIARRLGASFKVSWLLAAVVVLAPARVLYANYVWSEQLLFLLIALIIALVLRGPALTDRAAAILGLTAGAMVITHGRAAPFAVALLAMSAWSVRKRLRSVVMMALSSALVVGVGYGLYSYVVDQIYAASDRVGETVSTLSAVTVLGYLEVATGQVWYQLVAWVGLTLLGAMLVAWRAVRNRGVWLVILVPVLVEALVSPAFIANSSGLADRIDAHFYGRYLDPFVTVLALVALVRLSSRLRPIVTGIWVLFSLGVSVAFYLLVVPQIPQGANLSAPHVPGVAHLLHPEYMDSGQPENWLVVVAFGLLPVVVLAALHHANWRLALGLLGTWFVGLSMWLDYNTFDRFETYIRSEHVIASSLEVIDSQVPLYAEYTLQYSVFQGNRLTYWLTPRPYYYLETTADTSEVLMFLGAPDSDFAREQGARPYEPSRLEEAVVWIMPGPLSEALDERGVLGPPLESTP